MKKLFFCVAIAVFALASCSKDLDVTTRCDVPGSVLSIPLQMEGQIADATKSYLAQNGSTWNFVWEDNDHIGYFQYRNGMLRGSGLAEVEKTGNSVAVNYPAVDFRAGDTIYSYFSQPLASDCNDPSVFPAVIPSQQLSTTKAETYVSEVDYSFSISRVTFTPAKYSTTSGVPSNLKGYAVPSTKVSFKIVNYNPNLVYAVSGASNFKIDATGKATATVNFDSFTDDHFVNAKNYMIEKDIKVYVANYPEKQANITVKANATISGTDLVIANIFFKKTLTVNYSAPANKITGVEIIETVYETGAEKLCPVQDCMPCVTKQYLLTSNDIRYPDQINSHMTMYMLGSACEFRVYSLDPSVAVGETLLGVMFISEDNPCAGEGVYNILSEDLTATGFDENMIISVDESGATVPSTKDSYYPLYAVIAPGTYSCSIAVLTDQYAYVYPAASKTFTRAVKKAVYLNIGASSCTRIPIAQFLGGEE